MEICCGRCHAGLKQNDLVIINDSEIVFHEGCYDFKNEMHLIVCFGLLKDMQGYLQKVLGY